MTDEKAKQERLPGFVPKPIAALEDIGTKLDEVRAERMKLSSQEAKLASRALELMKENKVKIYPLGESGRGLKRVFENERVKVVKLKGGGKKGKKAEKSEDAKADAK